MRMRTGIANNAAIVFEEASDVSTTGIICTTVSYSVRDVARFVVGPCKS
jgi:hypothetical protein